MSNFRPTRVVLDLIPSLRYAALHTDHCTMSARPARPSALRKCDLCSAPQTAKRQLRRCGGCNATKYCGKKCQVADWPRHKSVPRSLQFTFLADMLLRLFCRINGSVWGERALTAIVQSCSFPSFTAYFEGIKDFIDTHAWALNAIARVSVTLQAGGTDWFMKPPKALIITLLPYDPQAVAVPWETRRTPTFKVKRHDFVVISDELPGLLGTAEEWHRHAPIRAEQDEMLRSAAPDRYVGVLPVCFRVEGIEHVDVIRQYPRYRRPSHVPEPVVGDLDKTRLIRDAFLFFAGSINSYFPLRADPANSQVGVPGHMVRNRGARSWQALFTNWREYRRGTHGGLDEVLDSLRTKLRPDVLMDIALASECI